MSNEYFQNFPERLYNGAVILDILRHSKIVRDWESSPNLFQPLTLDEGERAEDVAYHYYGDAHLDWLVYLANGVINPETDWYMDSEKLRTYIAHKYRGEVEAGAPAYRVLEWARATIQFYTHQENEDRITPLTYQIMSDDERPNWEPVSVYDYEFWKNENRRHIRVVSSTHTGAAVRLLRESLNDRV